ncbi:hypothetical protein [Actinokineospora enzanensis]|uniref:hypothetical protein n=1 Tax=Actinokineospora enzanensis TaxID=155975 RepID=UPI00036432C2|nr:hypothetical protein [Actinokineospora enzanensis]
MPDQSDREERGVDEVTSSVPAPGRPDQSNVTPLTFGSGVRLDGVGNLDGLGDLGDLLGPAERAELAGLLREDGPDGLDDAVDISRVHADDAFLDMLGAAVRADNLDSRGFDPLAFDAPTRHDADLPVDFRDDDLAALLSSWRDEVDSAPIPELVDGQLAVATVYAARARKRRRPRLLVPVAAAAAVLAIAFTGAGLAARDAQPGDTLWSLTKVLYADHARSVEAAASVRQDLDIAQTALAEGKVAEAKSKLEDAQKGLPSIATEDGAAELAATHADLLSQLPGSPAGGVQAPPSAIPSTVQPVPTTVPTTAPTSNNTKPEQPVPTVAPSSPPDTTVPPTTPPSTTPPTTTSEPLNESPRNETPPGPGAAPATGQVQSFSVQMANPPTSTTSTTTP